MTKLGINWNIERPKKFDIDKFQRYLRDHGYRPTTVESYCACITKFLESGQDVDDFLDGLHKRGLARSTIDNHIASIIKYREMIGDPIKIPFLKRGEGITHYFDRTDVNKIFSVIHNIKHAAMLYTMFYACLRASELCDLDDEDVDLRSLTLYIRDGKGGRSGIVPLSNECIAILRDYLAIRPQQIIDGRNALFYTDYGKRWDRRDVYRMFAIYKGKANIQKAGGLHVFSRHTPATLMIANGFDIRIVKELLRHRDIRTTLRYAHVSDKTLRDRYNQCLIL